MGSKQRATQQGARYYLLPATPTPGLAQASVPSCGASHQVAINSRPRPTRLPPSANAAAHWREKPQTDELPTHRAGAAWSCQTSHDRSHAALPGAVSQQLPTCPSHRRSQFRLGPATPRYRGSWTCHRAPVTLIPTRDVRLSARRPGCGACGLPSYVFELLLMNLRTQRVRRDSRCAVIQDGRGSDDRWMRIRQRGGAQLRASQCIATRQTATQHVPEMLHTDTPPERVADPTRAAAWGRGMTAHGAERIASHTTWFTDTH